jgi:nicotinamide phosphoribosyltransferase
MKGAFIMKTALAYQPQEARNTLRRNPALDVDSYKLSHFAAYPKDVQGMFSYIEPRIEGEVVIPFGLQMWIQKNLMEPFTKLDVDEAEAFATAHGEPFNRDDWDYLLKKYNGMPPVTIKAVPEGLPVPSSNVIVSIECTDPRLFWLSSYLETSLQRGVWYPTTIASRDYRVKKTIATYFEETSDKPELIPFMLHDFGGRGVSSEESAQVGGAAHLVNFQGSDTISGVLAANFYYDCPMAAFSVPAAEHSIQCAFGPDNQRAYIKSMLDRFAKPGAIVSIVLDGYDIYREVKLLCDEFKDQIVKSRARIVVRPDSGDALVVLPEVFKILEEAFGFTINSKGYKVINNVGVIQGDGIDEFVITQILEKMITLNYAADNIVFGSGGALLQKVNRDTLKFAQKASAILVNGVWVDLFKDPVTDRGKKSKAGRLTLVRNIKTGAYKTVNVNALPLAGFEDVMQVVYANGVAYNRTTLEEVRKRARI